jgi:hypothetical protein
MDASWYTNCHCRQWPGLWEPRIGGVINDDPHQRLPIGVIQGLFRERARRIADRDRVGVIAGTVLTPEVPWYLLYLVPILPGTWYQVCDHTRYTYV